MKSSLPLIGLLTLLHAAAVAAQVGHSPESSPFRDIRTKHAFAIQGSHLGGDGGLLGLVPRNGDIIGARYDIRMGAAAELGFGVARGNLERLVIDPNLPPDLRTTGPVERPMTFWHFNFNFLLTGKKSWHRLAPYLGTSLGLAFGGTVPEDTSGFEFTTKFFVSPALGVKWYPTERFFLRLESRLFLWKASYPTSFFGDADTDPVLRTAIDPESEWTQQPLFTVGLGYAFRY